VLEHLLQDHDHVADRLGRQTLAEQSLDELLDARQRDLGQLPRPAIHFFVNPLLCRFKSGGVGIR
jgi:hypothetical protein